MLKYFLRSSRRLGGRRFSALRVCMAVACFIPLIYMAYIYFDQGELFLIIGNEAVAYNSIGVEVDASVSPLGPLPGIGKVYVIHYAPLVERRRMMEESFRRLGWDSGYYHVGHDWDRDRILANLDEVAATHFTGALGMRKGGLAPEGDFGKYTAIWKGDGVKYSPVTGAFLGRCATFQQHRSAWKDAMDNQLEAVLVLEDDIVFVPDFRRKFVALMKQVPKDFDLVFVGGCLGKHAPRTAGPDIRSQQITPNIHRIHEHRCANGYVISRNAMRKLLNVVPDLQLRNIDPWLERYMADVVPNTYWTEPQIIYEGTKALNPTFNSQRSDTFSCVFENCDQSKAKPGAS